MFRLIYSVLILSILSIPVEAAFNVKEFTTSKGIKVRYRQDSSTPLICLKFSFNTGSAYDASGLEGTATLLASMLTEGTQKRSGEELSALLQDLAVSLSYDASSEYFERSQTFPELAY